MILFSTGLTEGRPLVSSYGRVLDCRLRIDVPAVNEATQAARLVQKALPAGVRGPVAFLERDHGLVGRSTETGCHSVAVHGAES